MKTFYLILAISLISCFGIKKSIQKEDTYYFYFDAGKETMIKYPKNRNDKKPLRYLYVMDNTDNVIFMTRDKKVRHNPKRIKIKSQDTINLNMKYRSWLNKMTNTEKYAFFLKRENKVYHLIEKDTLDGNLYLIKDMGFFEEIE